ncbi:MAG: PH domain-containing protein [Candidatus Pacebacteria bacterium]|nr:PH domain-containing protein [Candidatus Paceibacterota bacterium]MBT4004719.1 PH domain-containing protein [Candidatus Paceibacterota bacterium]MBT4359257.1 PH domain-containing protein [Candidatus Paceibacterota bacterium]MBT4681037.1 PH domain-containing protein [Candidatus Paceibacterota bacterium]MBT6899290.1 PH domain-containing protein [Candidatus Paceibacterota bacterium]
MTDVFDASKDHVKPLVEKKRSPLEMVDDYSEVMRREKCSKNPFDAFAPKPLMIYSFDSQLDGENVLLLLRKHPITQIMKLLTIMVMLVVPLFFSQISFYYLMAENFQTAILLLWYLITVGYSLESFLTWFYNVYIITDERIIDIDFLSLIYKNVSAAKIDKVEDITAVTSGVAQSIFDYGTVHIQTAAEKSEFEFEDVPHPNRVTQFLNEMLVEEEKEKIEGRVK